MKTRFLARSAGLSMALLLWSGVPVFASHGGGGGGGGHAGGISGSTGGHSSSASGRGYGMRGSASGMRGHPGYYGSSVRSLPVYRLGAVHATSGRINSNTGRSSVRNSTSPRPTGVAT